MHPSSIRTVPTKPILDRFALDKMRLYLEASINFLDGYPASERTPEYWLSWSLEYLCVEHVKRRISKRN
ncbi:hypothetical protein VCRA2113O227_100157 [Vibrio crassostreae]|nr:hypothetical protein CWO13_15040 [Vibrio sp. ZF 223]CAK1707685.1 hypothetical protein VCRA2113O227_100157 [Vibrio crassostreae]CAK1708676.1 hypothetical protein VCRA2112O184_100158 [Vibrio crassostreae]CAK1727366.1 hypothetical protein VCRA2113O196_110158 [Vibrio crassostreae]CAK2940079.1 hypothetical protein VCRA2119O149_480026 [Vibrio crassostreae]